MLSPKPVPEVIDGTPVLTSVRTWKKGHAPPRLAIEVVSPNHPYKDYGEAPDKYAANGTEELWVFDPLLAGPRAQGGPFRLQVWRRDGEGRLARTYAGDGPARSGALEAWAIPVEDGRALRIASSPDGEGMWPTEAEAAATRFETADARVRELEAELARLRAKKT